MAKESGGSCVGNETKADMEGALNGKPSGGKPMAEMHKVGAMKAGEEPLKAAATPMGQKPMKGAHE